MGAIVQRFAPSPTGLLHAGSLVAALASWLDARAGNGRWLVRIEDVDLPRCQPGTDTAILQQLAACGLVPDAPPVYQSRRGTLYQQALSRLVAAGMAYPCACSRQDIARALEAAGSIRQRDRETVYPGTCRHGLHERTPRAWRFLTSNSEQKMPLPHVAYSSIAIESIASDTDGAWDGTVHWHDRRLGGQQQHVASAVGDFVLKRADGLWAYQLAVVVDDAAQGITHVVRGEDLADNTARQILLQQALGLARPRYLHTPLVRNARGDKLSKQHGAAPLAVGNANQALAALSQAAQVLGLQPAYGSVADALAAWVGAWRAGAGASA